MRFLAEFQVRKCYVSFSGSVKLARRKLTLEPQNIEGLLQSFLSFQGDFRFPTIGFRGLIFQAGFYWKY